jgi:hypothetical protein
LRTDFYLRTVTDLLAEVETRTTDTGNALATDAQIKAGINEAVRMWGKRVLVPHLYALPTGFAAGTYDYDLPTYVKPPFLVQIKSAVFGLTGQQIDTNDNTYTWRTFAGYSIEPTAAGAFKFRTQSYPYAEDGRILYWTENGEAPTTDPTVTSTISSSATSIALTVTSAPNVGDSGYVKIEAEWIAYGGITRTSSTSYTLLNAVRGLYGTVAASHVSTTAVSWGVATDDQRLWTQLLDYVTAYVHGLQIHKATTEDMGRHEKALSYFATQAENFWKRQGYVTQRSPRLILQEGALGPMPW